MKRGQAGNKDKLKWCLCDPRGRAAAWRCILKFTLGSTTRGEAQAGAFFFWGSTTCAPVKVRVVLMQVGAAEASVWLEPCKRELGDV